VITVEFAYVEVL